MTTMLVMFTHLWWRNPIIITITSCSIPEIILSAWTWLWDCHLPIFCQICVTFGAYFFQICWAKFLPYILTHKLEQVAVDGDQSLAPGTLRAKLNPSRLKLNSDPLKLKWGCAASEWKRLLYPSLRRLRVKPLQLPRAALCGFQTLRGRGSESCTLSVPPQNPKSWAF